MSFCNKCGSNINPNEKFCPKCGAQQFGFKRIGNVFCRYCGQEIDEDCVVCPNCGKQVKDLKVEHTYSEKPNGKECNKWLAFTLCFFLGVFGAHKFYEGKTGMGILYIFTIGLFGFGWLYDLITLAFKPDPYYV